MSGRPLSPEEAALWQKLVAAVEPLKAKNPYETKKRTTNNAPHGQDFVSPPKNKGIIAKPVQNIMASSATLHKASAIPATKEAFAMMLDQRRSALVHAERSPMPSFFNHHVQPETERTGNLDGHWERRLSKGQVAPDMTVDLHGYNLSAAYARMDGALAQAQAAHMRVLLLITGKARPAAHNIDGRPRGAIRRAMQDWLSASRHAGNISAVRNAHPRHGGDGALYIILKRRR